MFRDFNVFITTILIINAVNVNTNFTYFAYKLCKTAEKNSNITHINCKHKRTFTVHINTPTRALTHTHSYTETPMLTYTYTNAHIHTHI